MLNSSLVYSTIYISILTKILVVSRCWLSLKSTRNTTNSLKLVRTNRKIPFCISWGAVCITKWLPSSRRHKILGSGCPLALQVNVTLSPSLMVMSPLVAASSISGGTANNKKCKFWYRASKMYGFNKIVDYVDPFLLFRDERNSLIPETIQSLFRKGICFVSVSIFDVVMYAKWNRIIMGPNMIIMILVLFTTNRIIWKSLRTIPKLLSLWLPNIPLN